MTEILLQGNLEAQDKGKRFGSGFEEIEDIIACWAKEGRERRLWGRGGWESVGHGLDHGSEKRGWDQGPVGGRSLKEGRRRLISL